MCNLANRPLTFFVNSTKINVEPIEQCVFDVAWQQKIEANNFSEPEVDYQWYCYTSVAVSKAIKVYLNFDKDVGALHKSGNISFSAYHKIWLGDFVVYSDYIDIDTIDAVHYHKLKSA